MTIETRFPPRRTGLPALMLSALLLAGCSTGHIGETWQCPLAEGGSCDSVAADDPAVPAATGGAVLGEPLWLVRETGQPPAREPAPDATRGPGQAAAPSCEAECGAFDPFGWLARLFEAGDGEARSGGGAALGISTQSTPSSGREARATGATAAAPTSKPKTPPPPESSREPLPGEMDDDSDGGDLRSGEVVARIWIAPFVDANGVYREASHVRVVLEPAGWWLP